VPYEKSSLEQRFREGLEWLEHPPQKKRDKKRMVCLALGRSPPPHQSTRPTSAVIGPEDPLRANHGPDPSQPRASPSRRGPPLAQKPPKAYSWLPREGKRAKSPA